MRSPGSYDVIVIGAGLGGLASAVELAASGLGVLVLERHSAPGGYASSFSRGRFEFDTALHQLSELGDSSNPGSLRCFFDALGLRPDEVGFARVPEAYHAVFPDGFEATLPLGMEEFEATLVSLFPAERAALRSFMGVCAELYEGVRYAESVGLEVDPLYALFRHPTLVRISGYTLKDFLDRRFSDARLKCLLSQLWHYYGLPPSRVSAAVALTAMVMYLVHAPYCVAGGSSVLANALASRIERSGGELRFNAEVAAVELERGRASGVRLADGERIAAGALFCNANPIALARDLLPPGAAGRRFVAATAASAVASSIFSVYLGLDAAPAEIGVKAYESIVNTSWDIEDQARRLASGEVSYTTATCYNVADPGASPPGTSVLCLGTIMPGAPWARLPPEEYHARKDEVAGRMVDLVEGRLYPGLRSRIEVAEAASPVTMYRYTRNPLGTIYGTEYTPDNSLLLRQKPETSVPGLYLCGAWCNIGGGYSPSLNSGRYSAHRYMRRRGIAPAIPLAAGSRGAR